MDLRAAIQPSFPSPPRNTNHASSDVLPCAGHSPPSTEELATTPTKASASTRTAKSASAAADDEIVGEAVVDEPKLADAPAIEEVISMVAVHAAGASEEDDEDDEDEESEEDSAGFVIG